MLDTQSVNSCRADVDDLDRAIVNLSKRITAANYELLVLIRQFDERAGWLRWGLDNCVDWLAWRCDLSVSAAREKVRVARALKTLPSISSSFSTGELSYSKVRALTRVTDRYEESELVAFALKTTVVRVEERCREMRCGSPESVVEANRSHMNRSLTIRRNPERGTMIFTLEVPIETGELVDKALDRARDSIGSENAEFAEESWSVLQADAMVSMSRAYLSGLQAASTGETDNYLVIVHVDQSALEKSVGRSGLPVESVKRLCCDSAKVTIVENASGEPLNVGRKSRTVPANIKRALHARDKCCRFPGCSNKRFVDAHHIRHWSTGGETSIDNLMLLCTQHHRLVHEGGFSIEIDYQDQWFFKRPDGRAVPACGYRVIDMRDGDVNENDSKNPSREGLLSNMEISRRAHSPPHMRA